MIIHQPVRASTAGGLLVNQIYFNVIADDPNKVKQKHGCLFIDIGKGWNGEQAKFDLSNHAENFSD
ncbi:MAG: hypothetical protein AAFZ15_25255 [Bacteroidota bacterium]